MAPTLFLEDGVCTCSGCSRLLCQSLRSGLCSHTGCFAFPKNTCNVCHSHLNLTQWKAEAIGLCIGAEMWRFPLLHSIQAANPFPLANWASLNYSHNSAFKGRASHINQIMRAIALSIILPNTKARVWSEKINLKHYLDYINVQENKGKITPELSLPS